MKKIYILFSVILLVSCNMPYHIVSSPKFKTEEEIIRYTAHKIKYEKSIRFKTPEETLGTMTGDCNDKAGLASFLLKNSLGIDSKLIGGFLYGEPHMLLYCNGFYIDCTTAYRAVNIRGFVKTNEMTLKAYYILCGRVYGSI